MDYLDDFLGEATEINTSVNHVEQYVSDNGDMLEVWWDEDGSDPYWAELTIGGEVIEIPNSSDILKALEAVVDRKEELQQ